MSSKNPDKPSKKTSIIIKDISKSPLVINWIKNPAFNLKLPPLQECKEEKNNTIDCSNNKIISYQRNLKTNDYNLNMTINNILDDMDKKRKEQ